MCVMRQRSLTSHPTDAAALAFARRWECVAFVRAAGTPFRARIFTCSRSYICNAINAGINVHVLADHSAE